MRKGKLTMNKNDMKMKRRVIIVLRIIGALLIGVSIVLMIPSIIEYISTQSSVLMIVLLIVLNNAVNLVGLFIGLLFIVIAEFVSESLYDERRK